MKSLYVGLTLLLVSSIISGASIIAASIYSNVLVSEAVGWDSRYGIFGTALREVGVLPLAIAIIFGITGIFLTVTSIRKG